MSPLVGLLVFQYHCWQCNLREAEYSAQEINSDIVIATSDRCAPAMTFFAWDVDLQRGYGDTHVFGDTR